MNKLSIESLQDKAIELLEALIATPSFSREEQGTAMIIEQFLRDHGVEPRRHLNNVWAVNRHFDISKPSILLNSHHDTVRPAIGYTNDPFTPIVKDGKLFGLGSNDAGGPLVALLATFLFYHDAEGMAYNLVFAATAEEEISGVNGIEVLVPLLPSIDAAIVGEPTQMQMAVAERGLLVLDLTARGVAGHAAGNTGKNALYVAMDDINALRKLEFDRLSELLGPVTLNVTVIETANKAHNVIPAECRFVVDTRLNESYTHEEVVEIIRSKVQSEVKPRSNRLRSTMIPLNHPLVASGISMGKSYYGSPTCSDKALMPFPALKMGPGDSSRSHTADEFIYLDELRKGIADYVQLLKNIL